MAYLTYDMIRHVFVQINTAEMLENPYDFKNVKEVQELYGLQVFDDSVDIKTSMARQRL